MTDTCDVCGESGPTREATMMKGSGDGGHIQVCEDCRTRIRTPLCRVCGDRIDAESPAGITFGPPPVGETPTTFSVCSECRHSIRFDDGGER